MPRARGREKRVALQKTDHSPIRLAVHSPALASIVGGLFPRRARFTPSESATRSTGPPKFDPKFMLHADTLAARPAHGRRLSTGAGQWPRWPSSRPFAALCLPTASLAGCASVNRQPDHHQAVEHAQLSPGDEHIYGPGQATAPAQQVDELTSCRIRIACESALGEQLMIRSLVLSVPLVSGLDPVTQRGPRAPTELGQPGHVQ